MTSNRTTHLRRPLAALALVAAVAFLTTACGGTSSASPPAVVARLAAAAPTGSTVNLDVAGDAGMSTASPVLTAMESRTGLVADACHPHLFARTSEAVQRLNAIFHRHLRHVEALITHDPSLVAGDTATWSDTGSGVEVQRQLTISLSADGLAYTYELDLAPAGQTPPTWVKVLNGTLETTKASGGNDRVVDMTLDYDALHTVLSAETLTGSIEVAYERVKDGTKAATGVKRTTTVTFANFSFGPNDPHGPRAGTYLHVGEPGVGGSLSLQDSLVLLCPANPGALEADTVAHSRWYVAADGSVHGRADAKATGGQIDAPPFTAGDTWLGVTCHQGPAGMAPTSTTDAGFYWAMKLEDGTGNTLQGSAFAAGTGATACDPAFGPVPSIADAATDYAFPAGPVSFPNEW